MRKPRNESFIKQKIRNFILLRPLVPYKTVSGHLLTKDSARVLICCIYDLDDSHYFGSVINTPAVDSYLNKKMNHAEIFSALTYLEKIGFIENFEGDMENYLFTVTHEGMHFFELRTKNWFYLFFNSVFLPLIISVITALATLLINGVQLSP